MSLLLCLNESHDPESSKMTAKASILKLAFVIYSM